MSLNGSAISLQALVANMPPIQLEVRNNQPSIITPLTILPGAASSMRSTGRYSEQACMLVALHEGRTVNCRLFSRNNIMFYATKDSILAGLIQGDSIKQLPAPFSRYGDVDGAVNRLIETYATPELPLSIELRFIKESLVDLDSRLFFLPLAS